MSLHRPRPHLVVRSCPTTAVGENDVFVKVVVTRDVANKVPNVSEQPPRLVGVPLAQVAAEVVTFGLEVPDAQIKLRAKAELERQ